MNKVNERTVDLRIRDVPESLKNRFKTACSKRGLTYREMLRFLLDKYEPEVKWR